MRAVGQRPTIIVRHIGYDQAAPVVAVLATPDDAVVASVRYVPEGGEPLPVDVGPGQRVDGWTSAATYRRLTVVGPVPAGTGRFTAAVDDDEVASAPVVVAEHRTVASTVADLTAYFRSQRSSGAIDRKDRAAAFHDAPEREPVDAHGGWLDASGDVSKFLSHLTYTRTMSPQQIPLCAWALLTAARELPRNQPGFRTTQIGRLRDEGLHGADFLLRFRQPGGTFYTGVFDALTKRLDERVVNAPIQDSVRTQRWSAAYRHGAGLAIAALALASTADDAGEGTPDEYLDAAAEAFDHLEAHNVEYLWDGVENVVDDHCALLAAAELAAALARHGRPDGVALAAVRARIAALAARVVAHPDGAHLVADDTGAPYHSAVESGLPVIALLRGAEVLRGADGDDADAVRAETTALTLLAGAVTRTDAIANPFGLVRQRVRPEGGTDRESFFFPHVNETGYWWQGENANLGSVAVAALRGARLPACPPDLAERLRTLADDAVSWVLGRNPFDVCMLQGRGRGWFEYSGEFQNSPGGILNGVTAGWSDERDVALHPDEAPDGEEWRWAEQWIPHTGWFALAVVSAGT
jgi:hypothetical protein